MNRLKKLPAVFYATAGGAEPVRQWLPDLNDGDRKAVGEDIATAEFGWPIGMPICRSLGDGLWEIRSHISDGRAALVVFSPVEGKMVLLHGFVKKSRKTLKRDLELAARRLKDVLK